MKKLLALIKHDAHMVRTNVIVLIVSVGLIVVPSFYAWFNIAASWDPYANTKNLKIAVASDDAGYQSNLVPVKLNLGDNVIADLRKSKSIDYVITSTEDAKEGVTQGRYYAALIIPQDFSSRMLTSLTTSTQTPEVEFYQNQKRSAIGALVTDKASAAVQQDIDSSFAQSVTTVGAAALKELDNALSDGDLAQFAQSLDKALDNSENTLRNLATDTDAYARIVASLHTIVSDSTAASNTSLGATLDASSSLNSASKGIDGVSSALDGAHSALQEVVTQSNDSLNDVSDAIDAAYSTANSQSKDLAAALQKAKTVVDARIVPLQTLADELASQEQLLQTIEDSLPDSSLAKTSVQNIRADLMALHARVSNAIQQMQELSDALNKTQSDITTSVTDANTAKQQLKDLVSSSKEQLSSISTKVQGEVHSSLTELSGAIDKAAQTSKGLSESLSDTQKTVRAATTNASNNLDAAAQDLQSAADKINAAADNLADLHAQLSEALASSNMDRVRTILGSDPSKLADFIAAPVSVDRTPVFSVANNGSAMAPFYTTLAIWIGGIILCAIAQASPDEELSHELQLTPTQAYLGRLVYFVIIGLLQASIILLGDLYFLGIQCVHPGLFLLVGWLASFVFV
ncbi:MAG: YhgE/Pip domain-containing protein, partial [Atopobium minutum]|nr:YhgE/Pip domain-containing protein [Atopobium minutum]